jgi:hypothetical protein
LIKAKMTKTLRLSIVVSAAVDQSSVLGAFVIDEEHSCGVAAVRTIDFVSVIEASGVVSAVGKDEAWGTVRLDDVDAMDADAVKLADFARSEDRMSDKNECGCDEGNGYNSGVDYEKVRVRETTPEHETSE